MGSLVYVNASGVQKSLTAVSFTGASTVLNSAKSIYYGSTLVWTAPVSQTWIALSSGTCNLVAYTPTVNMTVQSFSLTFNSNSSYNCAYGIWTVSGTTATPVTNACATGSTGVTITNLGTIASATAYKFTKTYSSSNPTLVAGTTYYFYVGERYSTRSILSGSYSSPGSILDWSISPTGTSTYTAGVKGSFDFQITYT